jgi:hypothetical protein
MTGRPSLYSDELAAQICTRLAEGEPLAEICRTEGMPNPSTVWRWCQQNETLSQAIADAREDGEERITADIRQTARGATGFTTGDVQRDKLIIETDLKLLAKWNPKKYGDKMHQELTGKDGAPLLTGVTVTFVKPGAG